MPILISSASTFSGTKPAMAAKISPTVQVATNGVACTGWTAESASGSSPSRDIAKMIRVCP
ncbi:hypothetical protein D3C81_1934880 [compost metagenome]